MAKSFLDSTGLTELWKQICKTFPSRTGEGASGNWQINANTADHATSATSAGKLTTTSKTAWGQTYWTDGGIPTTISGDMTSVGKIDMTGNITMSSSSGDSPSLIFRRGTTSDNLCDWTIVDTGGYLTFRESTSGKSTDIIKICGSSNAFTSTVNMTAPKFIGALQGNADSASAASKLSTARNIKITGKVSGNADFDGSANITIATTFDDRIYTTLVPTGTAIPANADLKTTEYIKVGRYYCSANATAKTLKNCPTSSAFMMEVYSPLSTTIDNEATGTWVYRLRKITHFNTGVQYWQYVGSGGTAGVFSYGDWRIIPMTKFNLDSTDTNDGSATLGSVSQPVYITNDGTFASCNAYPTSLPANGGNADTVDGKHASDFATSGHNHDTVYYKKAEVDTKIANLVDSAPETLNTLNELAAALGDDPNFASSIATTIGTKANKDGSNASGDWGINITGNAATATNATKLNNVGMFDGWDGIPSFAGGVMEAGRYIDFKYNKDAHTGGKDYSTRLECYGNTGNRLKLPTTAGTLARLEDFPTSLPADGGNADTVDGKHATDFAASGHTHFSLATEGDNRSTNTTPTSYSNNFVFRGLKNNSTIGIDTKNGTYSYLVGLKGWSDKSGGGTHELAFNDKGIFRRNSTTSADTWGDWTKLLDSANYGDYTVLKNGTGATGTWGINITGNAATATSATTAGSATSAGSATTASKLDNVEARHYIRCVPRHSGSMDLNKIDSTMSIVTEIRPSEITTTNLPSDYGTSYGVLLSLRDGNSSYGHGKMQILGCNNKFWIRATQGAGESNDGTWNRLSTNGHTHTAASAGAHTHSTDSQGSHSHTANATTATAVSVSKSNHSHTAASAGAHTHTLSATIADGGGHTHTATATATAKVTASKSNHSHTAASAGAHTHSCGATGATAISVSKSNHSHTAASAGAHTHTVTATGGVTSTFSGTEFTTNGPSGSVSVTKAAHTHSTDSQGGHTHSVTPTGTVTSTFTGDSNTTSATPDDTTNRVSVTKAAHTHRTSTAGAHTHTFTPSGTIVGTYSSGMLTLSFSGTQLTTESTGGHTHTANATADNTTNRVSVATAAHTHTVTPTGTISSSFSGNSNTTSSNGAHTHTANATADNTTNRVSVSSTSHTHTATATGTVSSSFSGTSATTGSAGAHTHSCGADTTNIESVAAQSHTHTAASNGAHTHTCGADTTNVADVAAQSHTHGTDTQGVHSHTASGSATSAGAHTHSCGADTTNVADVAAQAHTHSTDSKGSHTHTAQSAGAHTHSVS